MSMEFRQAILARDVGGVWGFFSGDSGNFKEENLMKKCFQRFSGARPDKKVSQANAPKVSL